ncbi:MAG: hypothetical protein ACP5QZ_03095 [Candidatus Sumerlaeaceae bacterium]
MIMKSKSNRAFVLLTTIGILAILGILVFGLALSVDLTFRYTKHRAAQRELSHLLRSAAEMVSKDVSVFERVTKSQGAVEICEVAGAAKIVASRTESAVPNNESLRGAQFVVLRAVPERRNVAVGRVALYAIRPGATPILVADAAKPSREANH